MSEILWRRLRYMLTPQLDLYRHIGPHLGGKRVLEVGFGTGVGTLQLVPYARCVTAIESSLGAVDFATTTFPAQANWEIGDIRDWRNGERGNVNADLFDAVVMVEVLEHIPDWKLALQNIYNLLGSGGELFMTARNANADLRRNDLHEREWTARQLKAALREFFPSVTLWDYTLTKDQDDTTHCTPLIARAKK